MNAITGDLFAMPPRRVETPIARPVMEERAIPGWPDYFAREDGAIISRKRGMRRILRSDHAGGDYPRVSLCRQGEIKGFNVHTLMALAFLTKQEGDQVVRHLDGNPCNNRIENLAYGSFVDNENDKRRHGHNLYGARVSGAKLSDEDVTRMRAAYKDGARITDLVDAYGLHEASVCSALHGKTWSHLPIPDYSGRVVEYADGHPNRGARHGMAKLTEQSAKDAVLMLRAGFSCRQIASDLNVSRQAISHIAAGRTWKHLTAGAIRKGEQRACSVTGRLALEWWPA